MPLFTTWKLWPLMSKLHSSIVVYAKRSIVNRFLVIHSPIPSRFSVSSSPYMVFVNQPMSSMYMLLLKCFNSLGMNRCEVDHAVFVGTWTSPPDSLIPALPGNTPLFAIIPVHVDDGLI